MAPRTRWQNTATADTALEVNSMSASTVPSTTAFVVPSKVTSVHPTSSKKAKQKQQQQDTLPPLTIKMPRQQAMAEGPGMLLSKVKVI